MKKYNEDGRDCNTCMGMKYSHCSKWLKEIGVKNYDKVNSCWYGKYYANKEQVDKLLDWHTERKQIQEVIKKAEEVEQERKRTDYIGMKNVWSKKRKKQEKAVSSGGWCKKEFLTPENEPSTSCVVSWAGPIQWNEGRGTLVDTFFLEISNCHARARLHKTYEMSMEEWIEQVTKLRNHVNEYIHYLRTQKEEEDETME